MLPFNLAILSYLKNLDIPDPKVIIASQATKTPPLYRRATTEDP